MLRPMTCGYFAALYVPNKITGGVKTDLSLLHDRKENKSSL